MPYAPPPLPRAHDDGSGGAASPSPGQLPLGAPTGRVFRVPTDAELKSKTLPVLRCFRPHLLAFHISWVALFSAFISTFAPAALLPVLRDALDLTATDLNNAAVASMCGAIVSRVLVGSFVDAFGPRLGVGLALLGTAPFAFGLALVTSAAGFIVMRMLVGVSLCTFVVGQYWCTAMFNTRIVGAATALSAGWGNAGSGATFLVLPHLLEGLACVTEAYEAWRWALLLPACLQLLVGIWALAASDDTPDGRFCDIYGRIPRMPVSEAWRGWHAAALNYRTWVLALAYGATFGVELAVGNVIIGYLFDHFGLPLSRAGMLAAMFGLMNLFSRALGGLASDAAARRAGMRGRLWVLLSVQALGGAGCLLLGITSGSLAATVVVLAAFSLFCQAACGAVYGVVPFVSKRANGLVAGIVSAGGNVGAAVLQALFFGFIPMTTQQGFYWTGTVVLLLTLALLTLYFPQWGGMLLPPKRGVTEESYYLLEYTRTERAAGLHIDALKFAHESRSERGSPPAAAGAASPGGLDGGGLGEALSSCLHPSNASSSESRSGSGGRTAGAQGATAAGSGSGSGGAGGGGAWGTANRGSGSGGHISLLQMP